MPAPTDVSLRNNDDVGDGLRLGVGSDVDVDALRGAGNVVV